jgi:hypothetical protein
VSSSSIGACVGLAASLTAQISWLCCFSWTSAASATLSVRPGSCRYIGGPMFPRPGIGPRRSAVFDGRSEPLRPGSSNCRARNSKRWSPIRERPGRPSRAPHRARRPGPTGEREPPMSRMGPRRRDASGYGIVRGPAGLGAVGMGGTRPPRSRRRNIQVRRGPRPDSVSQCR